MARRSLVYSCINIPIRPASLPAVRPGSNGVQRQHLVCHDVWPTQTVSVVLCPQVMCTAGTCSGAKSHARTRSCHLHGTPGVWPTAAGRFIPSQHVGYPPSFAIPQFIYVSTLAMTPRTSRFPEAMTGNCHNTKGVGLSVRLHWKSAELSSCNVQAISHGA
jgi:hypothetical protein